MQTRCQSWLASEFVKRSANKEFHVVVALRKYDVRSTSINIHINV